MPKNLPLTRWAKEDIQQRLPDTMVLIQGRAYIGKMSSKDQFEATITLETGQPNQHSFDLNWEDLVEIMNRRAGIVRIS
jgi:hypothetical protein